MNEAEAKSSQLITTSYMFSSSLCDCSNFKDFQVMISMDFTYGLVIDGHCNVHDLKMSVDCCCFTSVALLNFLSRVRIEFLPPF